MNKLLCYDRDALILWTAFRAIENPVGNVAFVGHSRDDMCNAMHHLVKALAANDAPARLHLIERVIHLEAGGRIWFFTVDEVLDGRFGGFVFSDIGVHGLHYLPSEKVAEAQLLLPMRLRQKKAYGEPNLLAFAG